MEVLNFQNSSYISNDCNRMANLGQVIPDICDVQIGKEDSPYPQKMLLAFDCFQVPKFKNKRNKRKVQSINIFINGKPQTTIPFSDVTNDIQNNNDIQTINDFNQKENDSPSALSKSVLASNVDNQQLPRSNVFKFNLANDVFPASSSTPIRTKNLLPRFILSNQSPPTVQQSPPAPKVLPLPSIISDHHPSAVLQPLCPEINKKKRRSLEPNVEPARKKFKGPQNVKNIISPIRFCSPRVKEQKRNAYTRNRIIPLQPLRVRNKSSPDYINSFIMTYWPEMRVSNPHNDLTKRFLFHGIFDYNSFGIGNDSITINCTAPYEQVLKVLSAKKHALQCRYMSSQYCWSVNQINEAENKYQHLRNQERKVYYAIKQALQLYKSFQYMYCKFDACFINNSRFTQASSVFPIIKSYENFYGRA